MVYGLDATAPIQIVSLRNLGQFHGAAFLSMILVAISLFLLFLVKIITRRVGLPIQKVWYGFEKFLSNRSLKITRDTVVMIIFFTIILIPALYIIVFLATHFTGVEGAFYKVFYEPDVIEDSVFKESDNVEVVLIKTDEGMEVIYIGLVEDFEEYEDDDNDKEKAGSVRMIKGEVTIQSRNLIFWDIPSDLGLLKVD